MSDQTMAPKEELKSLLESTAIKLLCEHNVQQNKMFQWIRAALKDYVAGMPNVRVLYNNCYGGFGLSKEFQRFCHTGDLRPKCEKQQHETNDVDSISEPSTDSDANSESDSETDEDYIDYLQHERTEPIQHLIQFAKSVLNDPVCAGMHRILHIYHKYHFATLVGFATKVVQYTKDKQNCADNIKLLRNYLDDPESVYHGKKYWVPNRFTMTYKNNQFENYTREQLESLFQESMDRDIVKEYYDKIANTRKEMKDILNTFEDVPEETAKQFIEDLIAFVDKDLSSIKPYSIYDTPVKKENRPFITILLSEGWKSSSIWLSRMKEVYSKVAMKFITDKYTNEDATSDFLSGSEIPDTLLDCEYEHFGLLCASDRYSNLAIAEMPALLDYRISEYDGLESVQVS